MVQSNPGLWDAIPLGLGDAGREDKAGRALWGWLWKQGEDWVWLGRRQGRDGLATVAVAGECWMAGTEDKAGRTLVWGWLWRQGWGVALRAYIMRHGIEVTGGTPVLLCVVGGHRQDACATLLGRRSRVGHPYHVA